MVLHEVSAADIWCMPIAAVSVLLVILALSWICSAVESLSHDTSRGHVVFSKTSCEVSPTETERSQVQQHVVKRNDFTDSFVYPKCLLLQLRGAVYERTVCPNLPHCSKLPTFSTVSPVTKGPKVSKGLKELGQAGHEKLPPKIQDSFVSGKWQLHDGICRHPVLHLHQNQGKVKPWPWHGDADTWSKKNWEARAKADSGRRAIERALYSGGQVPLIAEHYSDYRCY